jgi:hypothetical protein
VLGRRDFIAVTGAFAGAILGCHREGTTIPAGEQVAPDFSASDTAGQTVTLAGLLASGPAVVVFYRGFW